MDLFEYISVLTSIIIGLGLAHLLRGLAGLVQHPGRHRIYWVHLVWVAYMFFNLIFFWWWEFSLGEIGTWLFQDYVFIVFYAVVLYLLCAMLFPADLEDYDGFADYFLSRRGWFFGLLALSFLIDIYDTSLKGEDHLANLGLDYIMLTVINTSAAIVAAINGRHVVHAVIAVGALTYQVWWAFRFWAQLG